MNESSVLKKNKLKYDVIFDIANFGGILMINVNSLLAYYKDHSDYVVKLVKGTDYNIEFSKSLRSRKNVLAELYPNTGRFYLYKNGKWVNVNKLPEV
jgi:hypothetical protein